MPTCWASEASDLESVAQVFREIAAVPGDDGIVFHPASVTPGPVDSVYPVLLDDLPRIPSSGLSDLHCGKARAVILLGMTNSRLKDYFDLSVLLERETLDAEKNESVPEPRLPVDRLRAALKPVWKHAAP